MQTLEYIIFDIEFHLCHLINTYWINFTTKRKQFINPQTRGIYNRNNENAISFIYPQNIIERDVIRLHKRPPTCLMDIENKLRSHKMRFVWGICFMNVFYINKTNDNATQTDIHKSKTFLWNSFRLLFLSNLFSKI